MDNARLMRMLEGCKRLYQHRTTPIHEASAAFAAAQRLRKRLGLKPAPDRYDPALKHKAANESCATDAKRKGSVAQEWQKPPTKPGFEWRQCYKKTCHCMKGGKWHGPYRYTKKRKKKHVSSVYHGRP